MPMVTTIQATEYLQDFTIIAHLILTNTQSINGTLIDLFLLIGQRKHIHQQAHGLQILLIQDFGSVRVNTCMGK
jgi:hypothetical protein